jgi:hypothetical protein
LERCIGAGCFPSTNVRKEITHTRRRINSDDDGGGGGLPLPGKTNWLPTTIMHTQTLADRQTRTRARTVVKHTLTDIQTSKH